MAKIKFKIIRECEVYTLYSVVETNFAGDAYNYVKSDSSRDSLVNLAENNGWTEVNTNPLTSKK